MKKAILISILLTIFLSQAVSTYAVIPAGVNNEQRLENLQNRTASKEAQVTVNRLENLRERAKQEITRRLKLLNELLVKVNNIKKISTADKKALTAEIQNQIDRLTAFQTKINSDTDITTLREDVNSIIKDYYIFAFFRVKIELLMAADRMTTTVTNLTLIHDKLVKRVADDKAQGKDTTVLENELAQMLIKITDANKQLSTAESELSSLTAQGYPENKSTLTDAKVKIKFGSQYLRSAYELAVKVRQGLGEIGGNLKPKIGTHAAEETSKE